MRILDLIGGLCFAVVLGVGAYHLLIWLLSKSQPILPKDGDKK